MVLDIDAFRPEKGGDPDKVRENQRKRFNDVSTVDRIVTSDEKWRKGDFWLLRNYCFNFTNDFRFKSCSKAGG